MAESHPSSSHAVFSGMAPDPLEKIDGDSHEDTPFRARRMLKASAQLWTMAPHDGFQNWDLWLAAATGCYIEVPVHDDETGETGPLPSAPGQPTQPSREFFVEEHRPPEKQSWLSWSLTPFSLVLHRIKLPLLGFYDLSLKPAYATSYRITSLVYARLPQVGAYVTANLPTREDWASVIAERSYGSRRVAIRCHCGDFITSHVGGPAGKPSLAHMCSHRLRDSSQYLNSPRPAHISIDPATAFRPTVMSPPGETGERLNKLIPTIILEAQAVCSHAHGIDTSEVVAVVPDLINSSDGLGNWAHGQQYRPNLNYRGLRCCVCHGVDNHGWFPAFHKVAMDPAELPVTPKILGMLLVILARWKSFVQNLYDSGVRSVGLTAVGTAHAPHCVIPEGLPTIVIFSLNSQWAAVRANHPDSLLYPFQVPVHATPRAQAGWRVVLALCTPTPIRFFVFNAVPSLRQVTDMAYLRTLDAPIGSLSTGNLVPFNAGSACITGGASLIDDERLLRSFILFGDVYGWDENIVARYEVPVVFSMGRSLAPGFHAPNVGPVATGNYVILALAQRLTQPTTGFRFLWKRSTLAALAKVAEAEYDASELSFWHVLTDPRPVWDDTLNVSHFFSEHMWDDPDLAVPLLTTAPSRHSVAELTYSLGGITWFTFGTRGDRVGPLACARYLARWGIRTRVVHLNTLDEGGELLHAVTHGGELPTHLHARARTCVLQFATSLKITPEALGPLGTLMYSLAPPSHVANRARISDNVLVTLAHAIMGLMSTPDFNIGGYVGPGWVPTSSDGKEFMKPVKNTGELALGAVWGSDNDPPPGYASVPVIKDPDHAKAFAKYRTIICHGGVGTVARIAGSGAVAHVAIVEHPVLDRNYRDPYDAGRSVNLGGDPANVLLALSSADVRYLAFWLRRHFWQPWKLMGWYGVGKPALAAFRVLMLYLIYNQHATTAMVSTDPMTTLLTVMTRSRPGFATIVALFAFAKVIDTLLLAWNVSYYDIVVAFIRLNWSMAISPLSLFLAQRYNLLVGLGSAHALSLLGPTVFKFAQVVLNSVLRNRSLASSTVFLEYTLTWAEWVPVVHTALVCPGRGERYEGKAILGDLYTFSVAPGTIKSPFLIPTFLDWDYVSELPSAVGRYSLAWNCQTGLLINLSDVLVDFGLAPLPLWITAAVGGLFYGTAVAGVACGYVLLRWLPNAVGIVSLENNHTMLLRTVLMRLYTVNRLGRANFLLDLLDWWRSLLMPFSANTDELRDQFKRDLTEHMRKPLLWRVDPVSLAVFDRRLDECVMMGLPRGILDLLRSDILDANLTEEGEAAVSLARKDVLAEVVASHQYKAFLFDPNFDTKDAILAHFMPVCPPHLLVDSLGLDTIISVAERDAGGITLDVRKQLNAAQSDWLGALASATMPEHSIAASETYLKIAKTLGENVFLIVSQMLISEDWRPSSTAHLPIKPSVALTSVINQGLTTFNTAILTDGGYSTWWCRATKLVLIEDGNLFPSFSALFPPPEGVNQDSDDELVLHMDVAEIVGEIMAVYKDVYQYDGIVFAALPRLSHLALHGLAKHSEPFDMPLRKALWGLFTSEGIANVSRVEAFAMWINSIRITAEKYSVPIGVFSALTNVVFAIFAGAYELVDKMIETTMLILTKTLHTTVDAFMEYAFLGRAMLSLMLPQSRRRPKAVWALLFANDFQRLSPADKFALSCRAMTYDGSAASNYQDWSTLIAKKINETGLADEVLVPAPPFRPLRFPREAQVVSEEFARLAPLMTDKLRTTPSIAHRVEDWVTRGVPRGMTGSWFATPERVAASINRYNVVRPDPDDAVHSIVMQATHVLADQFPSMYRNAIFMTPRAAINKVKVKGQAAKYSPGLPFGQYRTRRELVRHGFMDAALKVCEDRLQQGIHPGTMAHCFVKDDVVGLQKLLDGKNIRTVIAQDLLANATVLPATLEATRRLPPVDAYIINSLPRSEGGVIDFYNDLARRKDVFTADAHQYDSQLASVLSVDALVELRSIGYDGQLIRPIAESQIRACYIAMQHAKMIDLTTGREFSRTGGLMTGQANTAVDNRDSFRIMILAGWGAVTGRDMHTFWDTNTFGNAGDDDAIGTDDGMKVWTDVFDWIRDHFGVVVGIENQGLENLELIGLQAIPPPKISEYWYGVVGVPVPKMSIQSEPGRLLMKKTEFRLRLASLRDVGFHMAHADVLIGSAMLTAHQPDIYEEFWEMYLDDLRPIMLRYFKSFHVSLSRDSNGRLIEAHIAPGQPRERYIGEHEKTIRTWLKAHRFPTYKNIFQVWVRPFDVQNSNIAKTHRTLLGWNPTISGLERATWGLISAREMLYTWIPNHVVRALPDFAKEDVSFSLREPDYTIAKFVWLSLYWKEEKPKVPSVALVRQAVRENPYASATDVQGFIVWLAMEGNLELLAATPLEAYRSRVVLVTVIYAIIETIFKGISRVYGLGILVHLYALSTRDINRLYSLLNHLYMLGTGRSSIIISNLMPSDPYAWMKQFAVIFAGIFPISWVRFPGLQHLTGLIPGLIEWWAAADVTARPNVFRRLHDIIDTPVLWMTLYGSLQENLFGDNPRATLVVAPTGTGKSTALIGMIIREIMFTNTIWLLCPTTVARDNYENPFLSSELIQVLWRGILNNNGQPLKVCTYGHFINRVLANEVGAGDLVVFDEIHLGAVEMIGAWYCLSTQKRLGVTATPALKWMPPFTTTLYYPGERRFTTTVTRTNDSFGTIWTSLSNSRPELLSRALIVAPTLTRCSYLQNTLTNLSVASHIMSSDAPVAPKKGHIVATTIVDTAVTISPQPSVLIDLGQMLEITDDPTSVVWLSKVVRIIPTTLSVHTQRIGRVGRHGAGVAFCPFDAGSSPERTPPPSAGALLRFEEPIFSNVLELYGIRCPLDRANSVIGGIFDFLSTDVDLTHSGTARSIGLAVYIFIYQSYGNTRDDTFLIWQNAKLSQFDDDFHEDIIKSILEATNYDPLLGRWPEALALLSQGLLGVQINGSFQPCTGLWVIDDWIWPIGVPFRGHAMALKRYRRPVVNCTVASAGWSSYPAWAKDLADADVRDIARWYGDPPKRFVLPNSSELSASIIGMDPRAWFASTNLQIRGLQLTQRRGVRPIVVLDFDGRSDLMPGYHHVRVGFTPTQIAETRGPVINLTGLFCGNDVCHLTLMIALAACFPDSFLIGHGTIPEWGSRAHSRGLDGCVLFWNAGELLGALCVPGFARRYAIQAMAYSGQDEGANYFATMPVRNMVQLGDIAPPMFPQWQTLIVDEHQIYLQT